MRSRNCASIGERGSRRYRAGQRRKAAPSRAAVEDAATPSPLRLRPKGFDERRRPRMESSGRLCRGGFGLPRSSEAGVSRASRMRGVADRKRLNVAWFQATSSPSRSPSRSRRGRGQSSRSPRSFVNLVQLDDLHFIAGATGMIGRDFELTEGRGPTSGKSECSLRVNPDSCVLMRVEKR